MFHSVMHYIKLQLPVYSNIYLGNTSIKTGYLCTNKMKMFKMNFQMIVVKKEVSLN